jgi:hypothetical protein
VSETPKEVFVGMPVQVSRRQAIEWVMAAVAASSLPVGVSGQPTPPQDMRQHEAGLQPTARPGGYGLDPNMMDAHKPGAFWPLTFTPAQKNTATALADVIIPKDALGPAASAVGVPAMIDEWVSAPYPQQQGDRPIILDGLAWIEAESARRFHGSFATLTQVQKHAICDDICNAHAAKAQFKKAAHFFSRFRTLCAAAYYATPEGWEAIGYVGNVALTSFEGPPPEVLKILSVTQTVA